MAKQIKNRREDLYINDVPPEIPEGIVTNTDYASASTAGSLKVSSSYGVAVASSGNLTAATRTADQYNTAPGTLIIGKGTLENVLLQVLGALIRSRITDEIWATLDTGTRCNFNIIKLEDGTYSTNVDTVVP